MGTPRFITLTNNDGDPVTFGVAHIIAICPHDRGAMIWTTPGVSSEGWGNWLVNETHDEIGKLMNGVLA